MKRCQVCTYADTHGHTPDDLSHCHVCHRSWTGHAEAHCSSCHRHFGGEVAFVAHQQAEVCRDPSTLKTEDGVPRFRVVVRKHGETWIKNQPSDGDGFGRKGSGGSGGTRVGGRHRVAAVVRRVRLSERVA